MKSARILATLAAFAFPVSVGAQLALPSPFHAENIVVSRIGTSLAPLASTGNPVYLDEYDPSGSLVQSIALPTASDGANRRLVVAGNSIAEGGLSRSADGRYLVVTGYDAAIPYPVSISATAATTVRRTIGRIDHKGNIDTSTSLTDFASAGSPRNVVTVNGSAFWMVGSSGGVRYAPFGGITSTQLNNDAQGTSHLGIFGGGLYLSTENSSPRISSVGTGLPTTGGQTLIGLPGIPESGSPDGFYLADLSPSVLGLDTLYVADDTIGLQKFSLVNGLWVSNGTIGVDDDDYYALTAKITSSGVTLYTVRRAERNEGGGVLVRLTDTSGYNGAFTGTPVVLATAAADTAFRGVSLAPNILPDLSVELAGPTHVTTNEAFNYTFTVRNNGLAEATGVTVRFSLPFGVQVLDGQNADGFIGPGVTGSVSMVNFTNGTLGPGATATLVLSCSAIVDGTFLTTPGTPMVDPDGLIEEGNEENNTASQPIRTVASAGAPLATVFTWVDGQSGDWSDATKWTNELADGTAPSAGGQSNYILNFNASGNNYAYNNFASGFNLNRMNFSGSDVFQFAGAAVEFTRDGAILPAITQSGAVETRVTSLIGMTDDLTVAVNGSGPLTLAIGVFGDGALVKTGPGKLLLTSPSTYAGATLIEGGTLALSGEGGPDRNVISDGGFERPRFGAEGWSYTPGFFGWTMTGTSGIASRYSPWVDETPQGAQVAFLQGEPSSISQTVTFPTAGQYTLRFSGANRPGFGANGVILKIDGNQYAAWDNTQFETGGSFVEISQTIVLAAADYTIELVGWNTAGGDVTTLIDAVSITGPHGNLPPGSPVILNGPGATFDIGNSEQTLPSLSGVAGTSIVNNGRLTVDTIQSTNFAGVISGSGHFVKNGSGTLTFGGSNTYTGGTNVYSGTLVLNAPTLSDTARVSIDYGATLELNFTGNDIVSSLNIGESSYPPGIYNSASPGFSGRISGSGSIEVIPQPSVPDIAVEIPEGTDLASGGTQDFGIIEVGTPGDDTRIFHVKNRGNAELYVDAFNLGVIGANSADFEFFYSGLYDDFYYLTLAPGETGIFVVRFKPTGPGVRTAQLVIPSDDPDEGTFVVNLTGGSPAAPVFTTQPDSFTIVHNSAVAWIVAASGVPAPQYQWYLGESGDTANPISGATSPNYQTQVLSTSTNYWVRASNASSFANSNTAFITVNPPSLADIIVSEAKGSDFFNLASDDTLDFGNGTLGNLIQPKTINVGNLGSEMLEIPQVVITGPDAAEFGLELTGFPSTIGSGSSEFFTVYLIPGTEGPKNATLTIYSNDADENPFTLNLTGSGVVPTPLVTTNAATGVTEAVATLRATVNPNGNATTAAFEFGTTTAYGNTLPVSLSPNNDNANQNISALLTGLTTGQTYHFRVVASNSWGTTYGVDRSFIAQSSTNEFTYTISDNQVVITGYTGPGGVVVIPDMIEGLPVVSIGSDAFYNNNTITSVVIPVGVLSISMNAFSYCGALTSVTLPNTVTFIGSAAFRGCSAVTSLFIPSSVTYISIFAFDFMYALAGFTVDADNPNYSSLDGVLFNKDQTTLLIFPGGQIAPYAIPGSVTRIENYAFYRCISLTGVTLPNGLQSIGYGAFEDCDGLTSMTIPASVTSLQAGSFSDCNNLTAITVTEPNGSYTSQDGVLFNDDLTTLIQFPAGKSGFYTVPSTVTTISIVAFINADGLTGVTLPDGLTILGSGAFYSCGALLSINIPGGVAVIGPTTFTYCSSLATVILSEGLEEIGESAFEGCSSLTSIIIPSTVTRIGSRAFQICTSLTSTIFYGEAPAMGSNVFQYVGPGFYVGYFDAYSAGFIAPTWPGYPVTNLGVPTPQIRVEQPAGTALANGAGRNFGTVYLEATAGATKTFTIRNIGFATLNISDVTLDGESPADFSIIGGGATNIAPGNSAQFTVSFKPTTSGAKTATLSITSNDADDGLFTVDLSGSGTSSYPFTYTNDDDRLTITGYTGPGGAVVVPANIGGVPVVSIGEFAFFDKDNITSIVLPEGIVSIGLEAFLSCEGLTDFTIPDSVTYIGTYAFAFCNNITQITIPENVSTIETLAFASMTSLTKFIVNPLNPNFTSDGAVLFNADQSTLIQYPGGLFGTYTIPSSVTRIGNFSFYLTLGLTGITISENVTSIGFGAFERCNGLTEVAVPASVASIEGGAFGHCSSLLSIDVDEFNPSYNSVGGVLLDEALTQLIQYPAGKPGNIYTIPSTVDTLAHSSFIGAANLTTVIMPAGLTTIGAQAFYDCSGLTSVTIPAGVTRIAAVTFAYCYNLASVTLPTGLTTIENNAFLDCDDLVSIIIPASVTLIESRAFYSCDTLGTATFLGEAPTMATEVFDAVGGDFYVAYYNPYEAGFLAPSWPGYQVVNLGNPPAPASANLANLQVSTGSLTPSFAPAVTAYSLSVPNVIAAITLTPTPVSNTATIKINGISTLPGIPSNPLTLQVGNNVITTVVTAQNGTTTKTYTLTVTRAPSAIITTNPAEFGANRTIQLKGAVIPNGTATVYFEYGVASAFDNQTARQVFLGTSSNNFGATLSGLPSATTFRYRAVATGAFGTLYGVEEIFTTVQEPPIAATGDPSAVSGNAATLVGAVDPRGLPTEVRFEYGLTASYGKKTESRTVTTAGGFQDFLTPSGGLIPDAIYHYRIVATNEAGTSYGDDVTFRVAVGSGVTNPIPTTAPAVNTGASVGVTSGSAILSGTVNPNRGTTVVQFQFGPTSFYGRVTSVQGVGNGTEPVEVSLAASGLLPGTTYHYRLIASNSAGATLGDDATFITQPAPPSAVTGAAEILSTTRVLITGSAKSEESTADVFIDFGTDPYLFSGSIQTTPATVGGPAVAPIRGELEDLQQGRVYYYRVRAVGPAGVTGFGETKSFQVALLSGLIQQFPDDVPLAARQGALAVVIDPPLPAAGWRFLGEKPWRSSVTPATGLTSGDRVIEFRPVAGFIQPPNETVAIVSSGVVSTITRGYTSSGNTGSGAVNVTLRPEGLTEDTRPFESMAKWAIFGEVDSLGEPIWRDSGSSQSGLLPGNHVIIAKPVTSRSTPLPITVRVNDGQTSSATITYFVAEDGVGTPPEMINFETVAGSANRPYSYVGQFRSDAGAGSGFVVRPGVVATAAHVLFDDGTLSSATNMQWLHRHDQQVHDPVPLIPRGYFLLTGYAAQRAADDTPGSSTPESQNLDAAAAYFLSDPGKGGFSGYLASDSTGNEFLLSSAQKTLVGYPVDGTPAPNLNRMHHSEPANIAFTQGFGKTYITSDVRSSGGGSGGPLCVQYENGNYYPAAIYLGGTAQTVVRAIDGDVADLIGFAEASATLSAGKTGGGITLTSNINIDDALEGELEVAIEPAAARTAGAGWRIQASSPYLSSSSTLTDLTPNTYTVLFASVPGFVPPTPQTVAIVAGLRKSITFTYETIVLPPVIGSLQNVSGTRGLPFTYQISASNSPTSFSLLGGLPSGLAFNSDTGLISGTQNEAGAFELLIGASNSGGADSKPLAITSLPALANQTVLVPFNQPMTYSIVSSESGEGVIYSTGPLPTGLSLDAATGLVSGMPSQAGTYQVPIQVTRRGATAMAMLQLDFTDTLPIITGLPEQNRTVPYGSETTLSVTATGSPEPDYQWYIGATGNTDQPIAGGTSSFFTTPPLSTDTSFWVKVSNNSGSVFSPTFTVNVLPSSNAYLSDLIPSVGFISPSFNTGIFSYSLAVTNETSALTFTPFTEVSQSTVTINDGPASLETTSNPVALAVGLNQVIIRVTAGDGVTRKTYTFAVTRDTAPTVATGQAGDISDETTLLHGSATPRGKAVVFFEYGTGLTYGNATTGQEISGGSEIQIDAPIFGLSAKTVYHFRIGITTGAGTIYGSDAIFETNEAPPLVATGDATDVETTKVKLIGAVDAGSNSTTVHFQWGETILYGQTTPSQVVPAGTNVTDIQFTAEGLIPGNTYNYRLVATNSTGTSYGDNVTFVAGQANGGTGSPAEDPDATTGGVADITTSSANLLGTADPNGGTTFVRFEYGLTVAYGSSSGSKAIGNGTDSATVLINVNGLLPGKIYHYRLIAANSLGTTMGADATFTTRFLAPLATTGNATPLSPTSARVTGTVRPRGASANVFFEYGTDGITFSNRIAATPGLVAGDAESDVQVDLTNLEQRVTYHYRLTAERDGNPASATSGEVKTLEADALYGLVQKFSREVPVTSRDSALTIQLRPTEVGAWRFVGETDWRPSGVQVGGLTAGDRLVEYLPVAGYIQPPREQVGIVNGEVPQVIERTYFRTIDAGNATLRVVLGPDSISATSLPLASRAQWRLVGETAWRNSNTEITGLTPGNYLVECKAIPGRNTPPGASTELISNQTKTVTVTYPPANAPILNPPVVIPFATSSSSRNFPYSYVGQFRTDAGSQSGFVVKPRVVATTSLAIFNDTTLTRNTGMQWLLQRDNGTYEPNPQVPRGTYVFTGYEAQRISEGTPGSLSIASQNLNVAALYFSGDAGRGGFSGYLSSDQQANEFLRSSAKKTMVGYPVNGVSQAFEGRMHATPLSGATFGWELGRTYSSSAIRGLGGMEGGPLCVQFQQGSYFPAAIYLGGTSKSIVRAIDGDVVDLFNRAEISGNGGDNNTGGGITHSSFTSIGATTTSALKVVIEPAAARNALAGWRLSPETSYRLSGAQKTGLAAGKYTLELRTVAGFEAPVTLQVSVTAGQLREITFTYQEANVAPTVNNVANVTISEDTTAGPLAVTLFDADDAESLLTLTASSSNTGLIPNANITLGGSGASRTVTATPAAQQSGTAVITLTVSDGKLTATDTFTLTVNPVNDPPTLSAISDQTISIGTSTAVIPLVVGDVETPATSLTLTGGSSNTDLVPVSNIVFGGSGANRTVTLTPLPGRFGNSTITVNVSDGILSTSRTFTLIVNGSALESWRFENFETTNNSGDAADGADPDGDGQTNLAEFAAGTNPNRAADVFRVSSAIRAGTVFSASFSGKAGRSYLLQRRENLTVGAWENIANSGSLAADGGVTLTDLNATNVRGFYRVMVESANP